MLSGAQLEQIKQAMEEEHRLDREALARLMRFVRNGSTGDSDEATKVLSRAQESPRLLGGMGPIEAFTILGGIEAILRRESDRTWTVQQLIEQLRKDGLRLFAKKPTATVSVALAKLVDRGVATVVRRGSGRQPNIYKWKRTSTADAEFKMSREDRASIARDDLPDE